MKDLSSMLKERNTYLYEQMEEFLKEHSKIYYKPVNTGGNISIIGYSDYHWQKLDLEGRKIQTRLYKELNKQFELIEILMNRLPQNYIEEYKQTIKKVFEYLLQNSQIWISTIDEVVIKVKESFDKIDQLIDQLYSACEMTHVLIPDTNALLTNPNIEKWTFENIDEFEIVLLPTVLQELDKLKVYHANQEVRKKAAGIIKKIKEYRRRGRLTEGVKLSGKNYIRAIAVEPKMENMLSWLDSQNNDDRIIASLIEVCRDMINRPVVLVTADINVQNKVEFANLPFIEPPQND
ncbi:PIN domain-containing protein [Tepidibacter formicigenes]|jgi:predicted transcriptional regulator|uniref:PIN domain-containing protein n=1 Tax=Tepidibacter formicigenes DSM 15518 TaxID=1123349 RepID=A0A1M6SSF6_9FIRM|nr:PIN domain-containing protein [Tepidibacter formicigenes]SHK47560.1 PIN domain-containing protein [Tepidibacter formicigenes DSM 15518]